MRSKSILWTALALLIAGFDITLFGVDILPDVIGYVILCLCFGVLAIQGRRFIHARNLAAITALASLAQLLGLAGSSGTVKILLVVAVSLADLLMFYFAFAALGDMARGYGHNALQKPIDQAFTFYAPAVALSLLPHLLPVLEKLCLFAVICLLLYVFNTIIRCYRTILLPVAVPDIEAVSEEATESVKSTNE